MTDIKFEDIRVGDRVRRVVSEPGDDVVSREFTVKDRMNADRLLSTSGFVYSDFLGTTWELVERPKPELKPGQVWKWADDLDGKGYLIINHGEMISLETFGLFRAGWLGDNGAYVGEAEITVKS